MRSTVFLALLVASIAAVILMTKETESETYDCSISYHEMPASKNTYIYGLGDDSDKISDDAHGIDDALARSIESAIINQALVMPHDRMSRQPTIYPAHGSMVYYPTGSTLRQSCSVSEPGTLLLVAFFLIIVLFYRQMENR
jgi:hypothetical protein